MEKIFILFVTAGNLLQLMIMSKFCLNRMNYANLWPARGILPSPSGFGVKGL
jgi:hypothetical protein